MQTICNVQTDKERNNKGAFEVDLMIADFACNAQRTVQIRLGFASQ